MPIDDLIRLVDRELGRLKQARELLAKDGQVSAGKAARRRVLSAEARERIAAAQRARWAERKKGEE